MEIPKPQKGFPVHSTKKTKVYDFKNMEKKFFTSSSARKSSPP